jgi:tetratricopeptide (TPR) repeat protein/TolB-like protein
VAAGVFLLATLIGALTLAVRRVQPHGSPLAVSAPLAHPRRAVAVLGFKNLSAKRETAWISTALAEMLTTELAAGEAFRLVPGESIARFRIETGFPDTESFSPDTLSRIRSNLGSELVVVGSYFAVGSGTLRLDLRLQDTSSGDIVTAVSEEGTEAELPALVSRLGGRLRQSLGTAGLSPAQASAVTASLPSSTKAVRLYAEGVAHLRVFEARQARDHLLEAAEADPKSPLVHSALAEAWGRLGYGLKARDAAKRSFDLSSSLSREERLLVEGRYQQMAMDWVKAEATFRTLSNLYPDSLEHGLRHAWAQASSGKPREALETVDNLRKRSPSFSGDPRLDLLEAEIAELASDFPREKAAAARSAEKATALRARLLLAPSNLKLAIALSRLGEKEASQKAFLEARRDFAEAKDRRGFAEVLTESAFVLGQDGRLLEAKQLTEEALATYRDIGDRFGEGRALRGLGILTYNHGDIGQARKYFERAVTVSVEIGDRARESASRNNLAIALREQGELEAALEQLAAAQKYLDESQSNSKRFPTLNLAEVLAARGDLSGALRAYQESLSAFQSTGEKRGTAYSLAGLGTVLFEQGDLEAARAKHEEALGIWEEIGERWASAPSRVALARIAFERRRFSDAENLARRASEDSAHQEAMANELVARALLMEILAEQKKSAAVQEKPRVEELAAEIDHPRARLRGQLHVARAMLLLGKSREALGILEKVCSETSRRGFAVLRIECRLVTAEAGLSSGHAVETRARLLELKREASEMGFTRLARRALRLGEPNP